MTKHILTDRP